MQCDREGRLADNPELAPRKVDIKGLEGADTGALDVQDVIGALERVLFAAECEREVGQTGDGVAFCGNVSF